LPGYLKGYVSNSFGADGTNVRIVLAIKFPIEEPMEHIQAYEYIKATPKASVWAKFI